MIMVISENSFVNDNGSAAPDPANIVLTGGTITISKLYKQ